MESTTTERTTQMDRNQEVNQRLLMSSKPLHRFIQKEPKSLGIVIVIFGCAELLMGFNLAPETETTSCAIYIPFWQGVLFLVCGNLSIYTEVYPSKRMVTVCLAMYIVSVFGIVVSVVYRSYCLISLHYFSRRWGYFEDQLWGSRGMRQLAGIEALLLASSVFVSVLLIFLCAVARLALKSTRTQIILQHIPAPTGETTSN